MAIFGDDLLQGAYSLVQGCVEQEARNPTPYLLFPLTPAPHSTPPLLPCPGFQGDLSPPRGRGTLLFTLSHAQHKACDRHEIDVYAANDK